MRKIALERQLWQSHLSKVWLWIGIFLMIIGLAGFIIWYDEMAQNHISDLKNLLPIPIYIGYVVFIGPIIEELAFRSWTIGKKWAKILGLILITIYLYFVLRNYILIVGCEIILSLLFFNKRIPDHFRLIGLMVVINFLFGFIHVGNVGEWGMKVSYTIYAMGIGLLLSYVALRFKFIYAVILHILWNGMVTLLEKDELMKHSSKSVTYQSEVIDVSANRVWLGFKEAGNYDAYINADNLMDSVILENNTLNELVKYWFEKHNNDSNTYFRYTMSISHPYYTGKIWFKKNEAPKAVLTALQEAFKYELKEQKLPTYTLDISQLKSFASNEVFMSLNNLIDNINSKYRKVFIVNRESYLDINVPIELYDMARKLSSDSDVVALFESIGIQMQSIGDKQIVTLD